MMGIADLAGNQVLSYAEQTKSRQHSSWHSSGDRDSLCDTNTQVEDQERQFRNDYIQPCSEPQYCSKD